jgi:hypothetical protein
MICYFGGVAEGTYVQKTRFRGLKLGFGAPKATEKMTKYVTEYA